MMISWWGLSKTLRFLVDVTYFDFVQVSGVHQLHQKGLRGRAGECYFYNERYNIVLIVVNILESNFVVTHQRTETRWPFITCFFLFLLYPFTYCSLHKVVYSLHKKNIILVQCVHLVCIISVFKNNLDLVII